jgi:hypothetical protein
MLNLGIGLSNPMQDMALKYYFVEILMINVYFKYNKWKQQVQIGK